MKLRPKQSTTRYNNCRMVLIDIRQSPMSQDNSGYYRFSNMEEVSAFSARQGKSLVTLDGYVLDPTTFTPHHPGGKATITSYSGKDITSEMEKHHPLSVQLAQSMVIGSFKKEVKRILDPRKPLAAQIWNLSRDQYCKIVTSPHWMFVGSPRLFESDLLQTLSYSEWYHVTFVPFLVIGYMLWSIQSWQTFEPISAFLAIVAGVLLFTLTEYSLHRFLFHAEWHLPENRIVRMTHFFVHGIHHLLPNDPHRLVLPPLYAAFVLLLAYPTLLRVVGFRDPVISVCFWSAYLVGYVLYDSTHYFLHFLDTKKNKMAWFQSLQQYHNQHHYGGEHAGFGVSSPLWDIILRTGYQAKKHVK